MTRAPCSMLRAQFGLAHEKAWYMTIGKKRFATYVLIASLALFGVASGFAFPSSALAWDNCPKGLVNDPYPGECRRYVDTNGDGTCDLSQSKPAAATTTTTHQPKAATTTTLAVTTTTSGTPPTGNCPLGPCIGCGICLGISTLVAGSSDSTNSAAATANGTSYTLSDAAAAGALVAAAAGSATTSTTTPTPGGSDSSDSAAATTGAATADQVTAAPGGSGLATHYNVSPIAIGFLLVYAVSFVLYKTKKIKIYVHRKIWNVLLLATFLMTGIFGLILTIQLDYALPFTIPFDLLFWHVEAGVVMTLISLFHIGWHFNYYRNLLRSSRKKVRAAREMESVPVADQRQQAWQEREHRRRERESRRGSIPRREFEPRTLSQETE
jgi:hypothetical protein